MVLELVQPVFVTPVVKPNISVDSVAPATRQAVVWGNCTVPELVILALAELMDIVVVTILICIIPVMPNPVVPGTVLVPVGTRELVTEDIAVALIVTILAIGMFVWE